MSDCFDCSDYESARVAWERVGELERERDSLRAEAERIKAQVEGLIALADSRLRAATVAEEITERLKARLDEGCAQAVKLEEEIARLRGKHD